MAYDVVHSQVVMFGGVDMNGNTLGDTWVWDGSNWTQKFPGTSPPARLAASMAYDAGHSQVVLFGGSSGFFGVTLNDTWTWDGANWTKMSPQNNASTSSQFPMAYDAVHSQVVLLGGTGNETWLWNGLNWNKQLPQTSPPSRQDSAMVFDAGIGQVVIFGGQDTNFSSFTEFNDTWVWDGSNWMRKPSNTQMIGRSRHAMAYDAEHKQVVMFGGTYAHGVLPGNFLPIDTWTWDGSDWTKQSPLTTPPERERSAMAYDAAHSQVVMFGGVGEAGSGTYYNDTWTWGTAAPPPPPAPTITSVVSASGFGGFSSVAPGSWVEIYGSNLAPHTRQWAGSDFNGNNAPTALDGVEVMIGGQQAFVAYISSSPGQINAQLPSNIGTGGPLALTVTNGTHSSGAFYITVNPTEAGLLAPASFQIGGKQYVVALFADNATYVLPTGAIPGVASRPAHPGETITLYGVGFGPVTPSIPAGQIVTENNQLSASLQILFGQTPAQVTYAGLTQGSIGLYQFDVVVPAVPDNDLVHLTFNLGGTAGTQTLYISVHQ
ncbi:MAG TPA: IPT/TIG domain-containing protein [Bryobacteraceae bacterium]|nr:IPT/TIG domain-containing protein [Bryobacteraceae bacterium]